MLKNIKQLLDKLDVKQEIIADRLEKSVIISFLRDILSKIGISDDGILAKNIDYLIMGLITLIFISATFASTGIIGALVFLTFFATIFKLIIKKQSLYEFNSFDLPVLAYITMIGLSVMFSSLFFPSLKGLFKAITYFTAYLSFASILWQKPKRAIYLLAVLSACVFFEAILAIYQNFAGVQEISGWQDMSSINPEDVVNRAYGSLKPYNPNLLAGYLIAGFSSSLGLASYFLTKNKKKLAFIFGSICLVTLPAILFTGCRGSYIAVVAMFGLFTVISGYLIWNDIEDNKKLKQLWLGAIWTLIGLTLALIAVTPSLQHRIVSIFALRDDSSNSFRLNVYASSVQMFKDHWLTGIGPGNYTFRLIYGLYMITGFDALGTYCVPLEVAVETGIFGLLAFGWLIGLPLIRGFNYITSKNQLGEKILVSSCIIAIVGMMVHGMVDTIWYRPQVQLIFWLFYAILASITFKKGLNSND